MLKTLYNQFELNESLFIFINKYTNIGILPNILHFISSIFFIANFAAIYFAVCIYFYYKTKKQQNQVTYFTPIYYELSRIGICYTLFGFVFAALKFSVNIPRPFCSLPDSTFITIANTSAERCLSSFPSAHTGLSILVVYCLWPYIGTRIKLLSCLVIAAVATSRITLAMHYPIDIIGSALVTFIVIILGDKLHRLLKEPILTPIKKIIINLLFKE